MSHLSPEAQRIVHALRHAIRTAGRTLRDIERELEWSQGYLSRIFAGTLELHFDHVVAIGGALGVTPREIWRLLYPAAQTPPSATAAQLAEIVARFRPPAPWSPEGEAHFEFRLERAVWRVLARRLGAAGSP